MALTKEDLQALSDMIDSKLEPIQADMRNINIGLIAIKHSELNHKLDQILRLAQERESLLLRIRDLEVEVKQLENKLPKTT